MKLQDHLTLFILPFTYDHTKFTCMAEDSIWEPSDIKMESTFLYPHVRKYLLPSQNGGETQIYSLKDNLKQTRHAHSKINVLFSRNLQMISSKKNETDISFRLINQKSKLNSPKLIFFPLASIGFLMFCVNLVDEKAQVSDLINLNYNLNKYNFSNNTRIKILPIGSKEEELKAIEACTQKIRSYQSLLTKKPLPNGDTWMFVNLIELFLEDIWEYKELNNSGRFHLFTYYQIDSPEEDQQEILNDFTRILRIQNYTYNPVADDCEGNPLIKKTFDEIYIGSSVESGGIMINRNNKNIPFFSNFMERTLLNRYLWIYILVLHQRVAHVKMVGDISEIVIEGKERERTFLLDLVSSLSKVLLKTSFSDISNFTHINTYYAFLSKNLNINRYEVELKNKISELENIIKEKLGKEEKKRMRRFEIILAVLLVPQILFAFLSLLGDYYNVKTPYSLIVHYFSGKEVAGFFEILVLLCWTLLFILIWHILKEIIKKK